MESYARVRARMRLPLRVTGSNNVALEKQGVKMTLASAMQFEDRIRYCLRSFVRIGAAALTLPLAGTALAAGIDA